jgi:hypothetical protein
VYFLFLVLGFLAGRMVRNVATSRMSETASGHEEVSPHAHLAAREAAYLRALYPSLNQDRGNR